MSPRIALITDSTCDIPAEWRQQYGILTIPLTIVFGDQPYLDGVELSAQQFYERLAGSDQVPTSSQPAPKSFLAAYRAAAEAGAQEALVFTISAAMSGTIESARRAAEESPIPVHVIDSKNNSMGLGWQVIAAARARDAGAGLDEITAAALLVQKAMAYYISLDTIDYLRRGGRISDAARFVNSILQIKPLIYVKPESGTVGAGMPARSRKSAVDGMYKEFFRHVDPNLPLHIAVLHNSVPDEAQELAERVQAEYHPQELIITITSPVLGVHTGPRALALCGYAG
jgi:DegV family protein with EDD domain